MSELGYEMNGTIFLFHDLNKTEKQHQPQCSRLMGNLIFILTIRTHTKAARVRMCLCKNGIESVYWLRRQY